MRRLTAAAQFFDDPPVNRVLRVHETLQVVRITHALSLPFGRGRLVRPDGHNVTLRSEIHQGRRQIMPGRNIELPKTGYAIEIDGILKSKFTTREGAEDGAVELKRRFPKVRVRIYGAIQQTKFDPPV